LTKFQKKKLLRYIIYVALAYVLYHYVGALIEFFNTDATYKKYQKDALHIKARLLTVIARKEYMLTEEGKRKILEQRLKELRN